MALFFRQAGKLLGNDATQTGPAFLGNGGHGVVRDLLLTGRSINATKAQAVGLVSQVASEGEALRLARSTATQISKFDRITRATAKRFIKPVPQEELRLEIEIFCDLFSRPGVEPALRRFVESTEPLPYLP